jgi:hypothetical protein
VLRVQQVLQEHKEPQDLKVLLKDLKVLEAHRVPLEHKVRQDLITHQDLQDPLVLRVVSSVKVLKELRVLQVPKELKELPRD